MEKGVIMASLMVSVVWCKPKIHIAVIEKNTNTSNLSFPRAGGAIEMALEHIKQKYSDTMDIQHSFRHAVGGPTEAGAVAADLYCQGGVDAFIGPGSSTSVEVMGHLVTQWNLPFITPAGASGSLSDKTLYPTLIRMSPISFETYSIFLLALLDMFSWKKFVLLHDKSGLNSLHWASMSQVLNLERGYKWTRYEMDVDAYTDHNYEDLLIEANKYGRVFLIFTEKQITRKLMLLAHRLGYTKGDHVFIFIVGVEVFVDETYWRTGEPDDMEAKLAFESALFLTAQSPFGDDYAAFEREVKERALRDFGYDYQDNGISFIISSYYDSFTMFAAIMNDTIMEGGDPRNGTAFVERASNRSYPGVFKPFRINSNGQRDTVISLHDIDPDTGAFRIVGNYHGDEDKYFPQPDVTIHWPYNTGPPPDVPKCGFRNDNCQSTGPSDSVIIGLCASFALIFIIASALSLVFIRRWKEKSEADLWWWKIEYKDLTFNPELKRGSMFMSKTSVLTSKDTVSCEDLVTETAVYKGVVVRLQRLPFDNITVTKSLLKEFKQLRDMSHANLVRVIGGCIDVNPKYLVTEFCPKGTLQDLLGNSKINLDTPFKFSLCTDITSGMCYLHDSDIHVHGNLTSATCYIDNRFAVKLADVGLRSIFERFLDNPNSQEYKISCLWKAPEILRSGAMFGSQAGDVYSFGIILQEVITREAPFVEETDNLELDDILDKIKSKKWPPFRPRVEVADSLHDLTSLMELCWHEEPSTRPTFHSIKKTIKALAFRFGASGNLMDNMFRRMEQYANNLEKLVDDKTAELKEEKKKSEELLYQILPRYVAERLRQGKGVDPEAYSCVTIYFSDICGFTALSARSTPLQVVDLLNDLYTCFDEIIDRFDVYKVETIGDAYMVASGLPQRNGSRHVSEIARMSLALLEAIDTFKIRHNPEERLLLRIGLHSGPVVAGVVGRKMPRYCLFGDTVNTASRMESYGEAKRIHISYETERLLRQVSSFKMESRGLTDIKGKGLMETFWLTGETIARAKD